MAVYFLCGIIHITKPSTTPPFLYKLTGSQSSLPAHSYTLHTLRITPTSSDPVSYCPLVDPAFTSHSVKSR